MGEESDTEEETLVINTSEVDRTTSSNGVCLVGRVWTEKVVNAFGLMDTMKKVWNPIHVITCREIETNLFSFQFNNPRDANRVLEGRPWQFNRDLLIIQPIESNVQPSTMKFNRSPIWIRIYDLPLLGRTKDVMKQVGMTLGGFLEIDEETISGLSRSVRMRVDIDLQKPLRRGIKICMNG